MYQVKVYNLKDGSLIMESEVYSDIFEANEAFESASEIDGTYSVMIISNVSELLFS